jgi:hypothetical protein
MPEFCFLSIRKALKIPILNGKLVSRATKAEKVAAHNFTLRTDVADRIIVIKYLDLLLIFLKFTTTMQYASATRNSIALNKLRHCLCVYIQEK